MTEELKPCPHDLAEQINYLAEFIMREVPGEPSQNEGAVECAIRVMREGLRQPVVDEAMDHATDALEMIAGSPDFMNRLILVEMAKQALINIAAIKGTDNGR